MTNKKQEKKEEQKEKKLTKTEHLEMNLNYEQLNNLELLKKLEVEKRNTFILQRKVQELESNIKLESIKSKLTTIEKRLERSKEEVNKFNKKVMEKYNIEKSFGINPDTGEILEE